MPTWVKICGITNLADAERAAALGADAIGFVFHRPSPRFVAPEQARTIAAALRDKVLTVGVWLDASAGQISADAEIARVGCIQTYDPDAGAALSAAGQLIIFAADPTAANFETRIRRARSRRLLLDIGRETGASPPNHSLTERIKRLRCMDTMAAGEGSPTQNVPPVVLAGGLTPDNVFDRLRASGVSGVDVASGVESSPGRKDPDKLNRFFEGVRRWDALAGSAGSADDLSPKP